MFEMVFQLQFNVSSLLTLSHNCSCRGVEQPLFSGWRIGPTLDACVCVCELLAQSLISAVVSSSG